MESLTLQHRPPTSCERGPRQIRPGLHLPQSPDAGCVLVVMFASGATCQIRLPARYKRFLFCVLEGWEEDEGQIEALRGYRTKKVIAARLSELSPNGRTLRPEAVPVYAYEINRRIREAAYELDPAERGDQTIPRLLENDSKLGYRIAACGLDVVLFRPITMIVE